jgi:hypothetical protein
MAVYWGRDDDTIHVIASLRHYVHKIASENEDTLEFVSSVGDRIVVALTDEEHRQLGRASDVCPHVADRPFNSPRTLRAKINESDAVSHRATTRRSPSRQKDFQA